MRVPRVEEWRAAGDPQDGVGFITYHRVPIHWWLLERWLSFAHPHWDWWCRVWGRILPYWGDPFCAAYITVWSRLHWSREEDQATIQVGWDNLPESIKAELAHQAEDDEDEDPTPEASSSAARAGRPRRRWGQRSRP
jgi:hypothetical protein